MAGKNKKFFKDMSTRQCAVPGCEKFLKQRIVDINPDANLCYKHHMKLVRKNPRSGMTELKALKLGIV